MRPPLSAQTRVSPTPTFPKHRPSQLCFCRLARLAAQRALLRHSNGALFSSLLIWRSDIQPPVNGLALGCFEK